MPKEIEYSDEDEKPIRSTANAVPSKFKSLNAVLIGSIVLCLAASIAAFVVLLNSETKRRRAESDLAKGTSEIADAQQQIKLYAERLQNESAIRVKLAEQVKGLQVDIAAKNVQIAKASEANARISRDLEAANNSISNLNAKLVAKLTSDGKTIGTKEPKAVYKYDCSIVKTGKTVDGYEKHIVNGFTLLISAETLEQSEKQDNQPLGCIEEELRTIVARLPEKHLKALRKIPIWIEWNHTVPEKLERQAAVLAVYYGPDGESLYFDGVDPRKSKCVTILTTKKIYQSKSTGEFPTTILLHELAHAVHDQTIGGKNPVVENAYDQAVARQLYEKVALRDGKKIAGYASKNSHEYFAELSACYLDQIPYEPFDGKGLREYDSVGYELMTKVWGTPEQIEKAKKEDLERKSKLKIKK